MTTTTELTPLLKRLKLGAVLNTLPERVALARREQLDYASFLQIILTDEINRRDHRRLELRLQRGRLRADLPPRRLRLVRIRHTRPTTPRRRLLPPVPGPQRARPARRAGRRGQELHRSGPRICCRQSRAYPPPRETDLQGIRTEAIGYREPDPPPDIYLASHSGSRPLDSLHKTFNRDGCRRNQFQVVRHVHIGLAVTDPTRDFHGGRCTSASGL